MILVIRLVLNGGEPQAATFVRLPFEAVCWFHGWHCRIVVYYDAGLSVNIPNH